MNECWSVRTLGQVADVEMGQSPPGHTYNVDGVGMPFMQGSAEFGDHFPTPVKWCSQPAKIAEVGDLLVSVRAPVGDTNFADQRIAIGRGLATVRAKPGVETDFLRLVIQVRTTDLLARSGTGMFSSITGKNLREFEVAVPALQEQRRIIDLVASVDAYIDGLEKQVEAARTARNAVLHQLLTAGGGDWTVTTLGKVFEITIGRQRSPKNATGSHMVKYLRAANVKDGVLLLNDVKEMNFTREEQSKFKLEPGDVLVTEGCGSRSEVGASAVWTGELEGVVCFQNTLLRMRSIPGITLTRFAETVARYLYTTGVWAEVASGTNIFHIGSKRAEEIDIALPGLPEQKRIVDVVSSTDDVIRATEQAVTDAKKLRSGLLSDLLSGEHEISSSYDKFLGAA